MDYTQRVTLMAILSGLAVGCASPARLTFKDETYYDGVIEASDKEYLYVRDARDEASLEEMRRVPRAEVEEIDHPGEGVMVLGGLAVLMGGSLVVWGVSEQDDDCSGIGCGVGNAVGALGAWLGAGIGVFGLVTMGVGYGTYERSKGRAEPGEVPTPWLMVPLVAPDGAGGVAAGAGVVVSW